MKYFLLLIFHSFVLPAYLFGQSEDKTSHIIDGGRLVVELIRMIQEKSREQIKDSGCKNKHADICVQNSSAEILHVTLEYLFSGTKREMIIQPRSQECSLQVEKGVWTFDVRLLGQSTSVRRGDIRIEPCQNMKIQIK